MAGLDNQSLQFLHKLQENRTMLDIMIACEDFLDDLNIYAFTNWFDGELADGPNISRHWVGFMVKWPEKKMPDPIGCKRLEAYGAKCVMKKYTQPEPVDVEGPDDLDGEGHAKTKPVTYWIVEIEIPRRFIDDIFDRQIGKFDTEINREKLIAGASEGIDEKTPNQQEAEEPEEGTEAGGEDTGDDTGTEDEGALEL